MKNSRKSQFLTKKYLVFQYTEIQTFTINCATWNVNGQNAQEDVTAWLSSDSEPPDFYAIGKNL